MNRSLRTACLLAASLSAVPLTGCALTVDDNSITAETLVRYEGSEEGARVDYLPTQGVRIVSANGDVEVVTGNVNDVQVTFSPFTMDKKEERDRAVAEIENKLELSAVTEGDIVIQVARASGASGYLGADIRVVLPASFDGALDVSQNNGGVEVDLGAASARATRVVSDNGSIDVLGARGKLDIVTGNGGISVGVAAWSAENGAIRTDNGDIELAIPAAVNGTMTAQADGEIIEEGIPPTWATAGQGSARSYTMGDGQGGRVDIATAFGDIALFVR